MSNVHMLSGSSWCWYPHLEFVWGSCVCKSWESVEPKVLKKAIVMYMKTNNVPTLTQTDFVNIL